MRFRRKDKRKVSSEGMGITQEIEASVWNLHLESACNLCLQPIFSTWNLLAIWLESACNQYFPPGIYLESVWNLLAINIFHVESAWNLSGICLESMFSTWNLLGICLESACNQYFPAGIYLESAWNLLAINIFQLESTWNLPWNLHFPRESACNLLGICLQQLLAICLQRSNPTLQAKKLAVFRTPVWAVTRSTPTPFSSKQKRFNRATAL